MKRPLIKDPHFLTEEEQIAVDLGGEDEVDTSFTKLTLPGRKCISAKQLIETGKYPQLPKHYQHNSNNVEKIDDNIGLTDDGRIVKIWKPGNGIDLGKFCREIVVGLEINKLDDKNFVKTLGYIIDNRNVYLYLEKIEGVTLREYLRNGNDIRPILFQVVKSLHNAHQKLNFTHYDLHIENIMVRNDGTPVVIDFDTSHISLENGDIGQREILWACYNDRSMWTQDIFKLFSFIWQHTNPDYLEEFKIKLGDNVDKHPEDLEMLHLWESHIHTELMHEINKFALKVLDYLYAGVDDEWMKNAKKSYTFWRSYPTEEGEKASFSDFVEYLISLL